MDINTIIEIDSRENFNSLEKYELNSSNHLSQVVDIFIENTDNKESKCRKVGRIVFKPVIVT